jgi:uncharacterized membrane protein YphA (DoxX/SURF4 family)
VTGCSSKSRRHCGRNVLFEVLRNTSDSGLFTCWGSLPAGALYLLGLFTCWGSLPAGALYLLGLFTCWGSLPAGALYLLGQWIKCKSESP